jgi:hypothetical protein
VKWARRHPLAVATTVGLLAVLVVLGGGAGWVLGERAARRHEAEARVREALEAAEPGLKRGNPYDPALVTAAQRAQAQFDSGAVGPEWPGRIEQLRRDLKMLERLKGAACKPRPAVRRRASIWPARTGSTRRRSSGTAWRSPP